VEIKPEEIQEQNRRTDDERWQANQDWYGIDVKRGWLTGMSDERRQELAQKGIDDLHFLCTVILGFRRLTTPDGIHGKMCRYAEGKIGTGDSSRMRRMALLPRGHFKTTIFSIGRNIQRVLEDPYSTHLILSADDDLLHKQISGSIGQLIKESDLFRFFYGDRIQPDPNDWSMEQKSIERSGHEEISEPTYDFRTVNQAIAGRHVDSITADDLVTVPNTKSQTIHQDVIDYWQSLSPTMDTDDFLLVGTRYRDWDLYGYIKKRHTDIDDTPDGYEDDTRYWDESFDEEYEDWSEVVMSGKSSSTRWILRPTASCISFQTSLVPNGRKPSGVTWGLRSLAAST